MSHMGDRDYAHIPVRRETYRRLGRRKYPDETWTEFMDRLHDAAQEVEA